MTGQYLTADEAAERLRAELTAKYGSVNKAAKALKLDPPFVYRMCNGKRPITRDLMRVAGLKKETVYTES